MWMRTWPMAPTARTRTVQQTGLLLHSMYGTDRFSCADKITTPATHLSLQFLHFAGSLVSGQILFILNNNIIILDRYKRTDFSSSSASSIRRRRWKMGFFHLPTDMNECLGEMNSSQSAQQALLGVEVAHWSIGTGIHEFRSRNATRPVSKQLRKWVVQKHNFKKTSLSFYCQTPSSTKKKRRKR